MTTENWLYIIAALGSSIVAIITIFDRRLVSFKRQVEETIDRKLSDMTTKLRDEKITEIAKENERLRNRNEQLYDHNERLKEQVINTK